MEKTKKCPACLNVLPIESFLMKAYGDTQSKKAKVYCYVCRTKRYALKKYLQKWGIERAILKSFFMSVARSQKSDPDNPANEVIGVIDPIVIASLYRLQKGRCAVTGLQFIWDNDKKIPKGKTLTSVYPNPNLIPVLAKLSKWRPWEVGNIVLVLRGVFSAVELCGGVNNLKSLIRNNRDNLDFNKELVWATGIDILNATL